ncbi:MAG: PilZ domain-containing protein [Oligoflexia bacterium]|nr:PilZ domain-containing protein [Oligoflexia bacterium]
MNKPNGIERRRSKRLEILSTFSLFAVVPQKGPHRLGVYDLSQDGLGFDLDIEEEAQAGLRSFEVKAGSPLEVHLYLNQSLYIPLFVTVRRIEDQPNGVRRVGAEFSERQSGGYRALLAFATMLDAVSGSGVIK